jgi:hypothetical protein
MKAISVRFEHSYTIHCFPTGEEQATAARDIAKAFVGKSDQRPDFVSVTVGGMTSYYRASSIIGMDVYDTTDPLHIAHLVAEGAALKAMGKVVDDGIENAAKQKAGFGA